VLQNITTATSRDCFEALRRSNLDVISLVLRPDNPESRYDSDNSEERTIATTDMLAQLQPAVAASSFLYLG